MDCRLAPCAVWLSLALTAAPAPAQRPLNLLLIVTDDQRADALGCAGHPIVQTPHLDRLAARGVRFDQAFVTTAICAASRASILTSRPEGVHGYTFGRPPMPRAITADSYPVRLRAAGYRVGFVGKWGVRTEEEPRRLFDSFREHHVGGYFREAADGSRVHLTDVIAGDAIAFLDAADGDGPFALTVAFHAPHADDGNPRQYLWPEAVDHLYADAEVPPPPLSDPEFFAAQPEFLRRSLGRVRWGWRFDTEAKRVAMTRGYYRMISGVDRAVGAIVAALEERGLRERTAIVFLSDNGYFLGERGLAGKWLIHEPSIRVPLIVVDPREGAVRGGVSHAMALNLDVPATLLDLAGVEVPAGYHGRSLLAAMDRVPEGWRRDFGYEHAFDHPQIPKSRGVRGARWVYARYHELEPPYEELYDLERDPQQAVNLAGDPEHADVLAAQRRRLDELTRR